MRILILSQWYPPEPALLLQELAQTLQQLGHEVQVLTGFPNYPSGKVYPPYRVRAWQRETLAGVPLVRVPLYPEHSRSGIRRIVNYVSFAVSAAVLGPLLARRPDVIFVYHPPLTIGLPAWVLSRLWRLSFVYQVQDMWPETLAATGMIHQPRILQAVAAFARWVYRRAAAILVISPGFKENLLAKGVQRDKLHMIPNWVDTDTFHPGQPDPALAAQLGLDGKFNVMFAGNIGEAQGLGTVLEAAVMLRDEARVQFVIVGDGVALDGLQRVAAEQGLANVRFLGRFPEHQMPPLYALADVLLVHLRDDPLFRITVPHKVLAYMASGKPILAALSGDAAKVVEDAGAGIACAPQQPAALAAAVRQLQALTPEARATMGQRARDAAERQYDRVQVVSDVEAVLKAVARTRD